MVPTEPQSLRLQVLAYPLKQPLPQLVLLQQMAELAHRGLVRHRFPPQIDAHKLPHPRRIVQSFFHSGVGQVEPLLQKVNPQHPLRPHRRPPIAHLGIHRFDQRTQLRPRHYLLHLLQKQRPSRLLRVALKPVCHRQRLLFHLRISPPPPTLSSTPVDIRELIQSLPSRLKQPRKPALSEVEGRRKITAHGASRG